MKFRVLGPLELDREGLAVRLPGGRPRTLLALLIIHRGQALSTDRIIEELWGEGAPPTAARIVQTYVSQLRKLLEPGALVTTATGYRLEAGELDAAEFADGVDSARARLAAGDARGALADADAALSRWRGAAYEDAAYEAFAQPEINRLDELRLNARELRSEAMLSLGEPATVAAELEPLAAANPLRERLQELRMLALYRAGRPADALAVFDGTRRRLAEELGLEPGAGLRALHQRILEQDPGLGAPAEVPSLPVAPVPRPRRAGLVAAALATVAAVVVATVLALSGEERPGVEAVRPNSVAAIDVASGRVVEQARVGRTPTGVAVAAGRVWTVNSDDSTLSRLDLATGEVEALGVGATPLDVAAYGDSVWVAAGSPNARIQSAGAEITSVVRIDARTGSVRNTTDLPALGDVRGAGGPYLISAGPEGVWVINPDFTVSRLDPRNGAVTASVDVHAQALAAGDGRVAVLTDQDTIAVIAPGRNEVVRVVDLPAELPLGIALGMDSIWVTDPRQGILWRIQPGDRNILRTIEVGAGASAVATGTGSIWVGNPVRGTVSRVDPETNAVAATIPVGPAPFALAVSDARVWAAVGEGAGPAATQSKDGRAVDTPGCGPLIAGPGPPPEKVVLTYSPLSSPRYDAAALSQASEFVLRKRGFRAGSFRVGVQHCDQATAQQESFTPEKCVSNARTFAEQPRVLAVIGPFNSGCAAEMIPLANRAGLAIVSPANTFTGLTRPTAGEAPDLLERLHPTGRRTYLRVVAPDDIQGAGIALEARELRVRRAFLVHDGDGYSAGVLHYVRLAARRLGLRIAGSVRWQPEGDHALLARAFSKSGGDGLIVVGLHANHVGEVVAALRRHLGNGVPMIGPDSMLPVSTLFREAGSAAKSVHIAAPQLDPARLPQRGRAFLEEFARTQPEPPRMLYTIYGAVAAEVILDALARSDGSRGGLVRELFATRVRDGLAGPLRFDASGDVVPGHVTIYRPVRGGGSPKVPSADGAVVERVFTPDPKLVR